MQLKNRFAVFACKTAQFGKIFVDICQSGFIDNIINILIINITKQKYTNTK